MDNRKYFPNINDKLLNDLMTEHNVSSDQINSHPAVVFVDFDFDS